MKELAPTKTAIEMNRLNKTNFIELIDGEPHYRIPLIVKTREEIITECEGVPEVEL